MYLALWRARCRAGCRRCRDPARIAAPRAQATPAAATDPDALYARRDDLASARQAAAIWAERLKQNPKDFEAAWKLARARYWLGGHAPEAERKALLEAASPPARTAVALEPNRPEGHFWIAANMGALAESFGLRQGLKYRGDIKDALLTVLKLDPAFQQGSADRALGRWYLQGAGPVRRQQQEVRGAPAQVAHLQPEQHRVACSSSPRR